jgi:hypothetical protein
MVRSRDRLRLAPDDHSAQLMFGWRPKTTSEGPACHLGGSPDVCRTWTRGLSTPHRFATIEDADVAKSTRGFPRSDSETRYSTVKITPVSRISATVPTTHTVA